MQFRSASDKYSDALEHLQDALFKLEQAKSCSMSDGAYRRICCAIADLRLVGRSLDGKQTDVSND